MNDKSSYSSSAIVKVCALSLLSGLSFANGYYIPEQNVTHLGMAYAGTASLANDASINFYNAAGLTRLEGRQLVGGLIVANSNTNLQVSRATDTFGNTIPTGAAKPHALAKIPILHYSQKLNDKFAIGGSIVSTFGSKNNYASDSVARYVSTKSEMLTLNIAPSIAYKLSDKLSIGIGPDIIYVKAILNTATGSGNTATDGFSNAAADTTATGMHAGIMYEFNDDTRLGINYRSMVRARVKGIAHAKTSPTASDSYQGVRSEVELPDMVAVSGYHAFNDKWAIMADAQWFNWSRLDKLTLSYENNSEVIFTYNYKDSYRVALGATYNYDDRWQLKFGTSFDKTPTKNGFRNIAVSDHDQLAVGIGLKYAYNDALTFDFGFVHIFQKDADIDTTPPAVVNVAASASSIMGTVKTHINAAGIQVRWNF